MHSSPSVLGVYIYLWWVSALQSWSLLGVKYSWRGITCVGGHPVRPTSAMCHLPAQLDLEWPLISSCDSCHTAVWKYATGIPHPSPFIKVLLLFTQDSSWILYSRHCFSTCIGEQNHVYFCSFSTLQVIVLQICILTIVTDCQSITGVVRTCLYNNRSVGAHYERVTHIVTGSFYRISSPFHCFILGATTCCCHTRLLSAVRIAQIKAEVWRCKKLAWAEMIGLALVLPSVGHGDIEAIDTRPIQVKVNRSDTCMRDVVNRLFSGERLHK